MVHPGPEHWPSLSGYRGETWAERRWASRRHGPDRAETALVVAGVLAVGAGLLAWAYLGPDLKRYMKIHSM